jgi:hypothetical protein
MPDLAAKVIETLGLVVDALPTNHQALYPLRLDKRPITIPALPQTDLSRDIFFCLASLPITNIVPEVGRDSHRHPGLNIPPAIEPVRSLAHGQHPLNGSQGRLPNVLR